MNCKSILGRRQRTDRRPAALRLEPLEVRQMLDAALINEIYLDPPAGGDVIHEYVELRGTPGMSLDNYYLVILENENNAQNTGNPGQIEKIFNLNGQTMGTNGFLTYREAGNSYTVAPGTTDLPFTGTQLENSGFTAMLVKTDGQAANVPQLNFDLDVGNDGLDLANGHAGWTIDDSIGVFSEMGEATFGRLYAKVNFGPEISTNIEPGATYTAVGYEIEYLGRWGNSTGSAADDWHVANLTDSVESGFTGQGDFRQSADPQGSANVESNHNVPYGTNLTNTLGAPNYPANIVVNSTVAARNIFYNQSAFDGNSALINAALDNAAIAPGKTPYLPGAGVAVYNNITSFSRGINGIIVDLSPGITHTGITASDFTFKVGNNNSPSTWAAAPAPSAVSVIPGGGAAGSDRVEIIWANGVIKNQWLEVQVKATANTGLAATDVHFWGNKIGDSGSGSPATLFETTSTDSAQVTLQIGPGKPITDLRDYNRDGQVSSTDSAVVLVSIGSITRINIAGGPFAPDAAPAVASDDGGSAVASALAAAASPTGLPKVPGWIATRIAVSELNTAALAKVFGQWADQPVSARPTVSGLQQPGDATEGDDDLLDSLLDDISLA